MSEPIDETIRRILTSIKTIAVVGASDKKHRASNGVMHFLQDHGYRCIPVNPRLAGRKLLGETVYESVRDVPEPIDMVDIFRRSEEVEPIAKAAIDVGAKVLWMQLGVINKRAAERADEAGLDVIMNRCPAIEIPRLGIEARKAD